MKKLIFLLLLAPTIVYSQQYVAEAPMPEIKASGFYAIPLPPNITSSLADDLRNIRILDAQEVEVPYVTTSERPVYSKVEWAPMKIETSMETGCCTIVTIFNEEKSYIDNFLLRVKNAKVYKMGALRGSNDKKTWYAVVEKFPLNVGELKSEEVTEVFDFPLSNYAYYQLTINDSTTTPLNIVGALKTKEDIIHGSLVEIPNVNVTSRDSLRERITWATITFDTAQYVDRLEFDVEGPHLFKRRATLYRKEEYTVKGKTKVRLAEIYSFDVISGQARPLTVGYKEKELFIRIDNESNPPLKFTQVAAYQLKRSLVAYLEKGRTYRIALGSDLEKPFYDLEFFKDSIPAHPTELEFGRLKERSVLKTPEPSTFFTSRKIIWAAIILVGAILATMTVRMLRDKDLNQDSTNQ